MELPMRKITLTVAAALAFFSLPALAQTTSGTVALKGTVPLVCTVGVTDLNQSLNLTGGESAKQVGSIVENCNSGTGYNISISSANTGKLKAATGTATINYTVGYDGTAGNLTSAMTVGRSTAQFAKTSALNVTVPANAQAIAGNYSDTVTITIAAK
jgi:spore coat protein U-like protein